MATKEAINGTDIRFLINGKKINSVISENVAIGLKLKKVFTIEALMVNNEGRPFASNMVKPSVSGLSVEEVLNTVKDEVIINVTYNNNNVITKTKARLIRAVFYFKLDEAATYELILKEI